MDFVANQEPQIQEMLKVIGVDSIDELFSSIDASLKLPPPLLDDGYSELEGKRRIESLAKKNTFVNFDSYLGMGSYDHYLPAITSTICQKSGFLTSYTPYQAEASQGSLQAMFEFQTAISLLTGMEIANASLYDGASACAEALLMALRYKKQSKNVLIAEALNPHYRLVTDQYLENVSKNQKLQVKTIPFVSSGALDITILEKEINQETAAFLVQSPNVLGGLEDLELISSICKEKEVLLIVSGNPLSFGLFNPPGKWGADISVGDLQPLGASMQFGGPYAGYLACSKKLMRQMPGRVVGETKDSNGNIGYVLTQQAREQHIRRQKATSNICTNQSLVALASLVTMMWYGKEGLRELALINYQRAHYLQEALKKIPGVKVIGGERFFNEFAVCFPVDREIVLSTFRERGIEVGVSLDDYYPQLKGYFLVAVTEKKTKEQLDHFIACAVKLSNI